MGGARVLITRRLAAAALVVVMACSATSGSVKGPVTSVKGDLTEVTSFSVLVEGEEWSFVPTDGGDYAFPLQHLGEHQKTGDPIIVGWELRDDVRYALSVVDG